MIQRLINQQNCRRISIIKLDACFLNKKQVKIDNQQAWKEGVCADQ